MRGILAILFACAVALGVYFFLFAPEPVAPENVTATVADAIVADEVRPVIVVGTTPVHGLTITSLPQLIAVRAQEPLADASTLTVAWDGQSVAGLERSFTSDRMSMEVHLPEDAASGVYAVTYRPCRAAGQCGEGSFAFRVR